ncbi:MAG: 3-dehydroquinate synthase [Treponema sp.]|jgi:3-dehydroquinate synthase|nr:3-dehydroquinate synthase [Treponema sp.]
MRDVYRFRFGPTETMVIIQEAFPSREEVCIGNNGLVLCDTNTESIARTILPDMPYCVIPAGEMHKNWQSVSLMLQAAHKAGISRDGCFIAVGGGVVSDMAGFAASVYMRGVSFSIVATTLLAMVDAAIGGKTACDYCDLKNLIGTFYPASKVFIPLESLKTLPALEWKSGRAELIKTAILNRSEHILDRIAALSLEKQISRAVAIKGSIVESDPYERGEKRIILNLGHTFGHALETATGLGTVSHGEAVAWGIARACALGEALGNTPPERSKKILDLLSDYETQAPHPLLRNSQAFLDALYHDKKKKGTTLRFIVPAAQGVTVVSSDHIDQELLNRIIGITDSTAS